jgi:hypothetical protein
VIIQLYQLFRDIHWADGVNDLAAISCYPAAITGAWGNQMANETEAEIRADIRADIRVMGASGIEEYYAHLLRLDPAERFPDGAAIDSHCLNLITSGAILVGAYVDGVMRAAAEVVPDRTARQAMAAITVEQGYDDRGFAPLLIERITNEARRYHLSMLRVLDQSSITNIQITEAQAVNG